VLSQLYWLLSTSVQEMASWTFTARFFFVVRWDSAIEMAGEWFSPTFRSFLKNSGDKAFCIVEFSKSSSLAIPVTSDFAKNGQCKLRNVGSHRPEKPNVFGQQSIREGMQRLHERSAIDLFRHDAMSWIDLVHQLDTRTYGLASGCPTVVMVQPSYDWKNDHLFACMMRGKR